jgi:general secretion pathway protein L
MMAMQAVTRIASLINLRQGGYRVPVDLRASGRWVRHTVAAAVAGSLLFIFASLGKALWYESQESGINQQTVALYKEIFPEARRVINPRKQMESVMSGATDISTSDEFTATLEDIGELIASSQNAEVSIQTVLFSADQPETISMSMILSQEDALDEMQERLSATDLRIDGPKKTPVSNGVAVDFRLLRGQ